MRMLAIVRKRTRSRDEGGSVLVTVLAVIAVLAVILSALVGLTNASQRATKSFKDQRNDRYEGDAAIKAAVNWAAAKSDVGRDPEYFTGPNADPACAYVVPASGTLPSVVVTCAAEAGSGSGVPADTGKTPAQALLLLGQRYGESVYNSPCTNSSRADRKSGEVGLRLNSGRLGSSGGNIVCQFPSSGQFDASKPFQVKGAIKSNGPVVADQGKLVVLNPDKVTAGSSPLFGSQACVAAPGAQIQVQAAASCDLVAAARNRANPASGAPASDPWNPGETLFTDPAVTGSNTAEWRQGTINWRAPQVSINGGAPIPLTITTPLAACTGTQSDLVRFYPGWYSSAAALNRIFNDTDGGKTCKSGVFWFPPAADSSDTISAAVPDPAQAQQGVYLFDFRDTGTGTDNTGIVCQYFQNTNYPHRWCLDASTADGGARVVGGWPAGWDPTTQIGSTGSASTTVSLGAAQASTDGSSTWYTGGSANNATGASSLDGTYAKYDPIFTSVNRSLVLSNYARKLTAVDPAGNPSITVRHREHRSTYLDPPNVTVSTTDRGIAVDCGRYAVPKSYDSSPSSGGNGTDQPRTDVISTDPGVSTISLSVAQRATLKSCFQSAERVNNIKLKWSVTGNYTNINWSNPFGGPPNLFLDGMDVQVQVPTGGWFPTGGNTKAVYCDPKAEAGVQFIFGGDSTVHAGQASMQLCAGQAPQNPSQYQQIAVWGQPQNFLTKDNGGSQVETRVGKTGRSSLVPTTQSQVAYTCQWNACGLTQPIINSGDRALASGSPYTDPADPVADVSAEYDMGYTWTLLGAGDTTLTGKYSGYGGVKAYASCNASKDLCIDTATQKVDRVELKVAYNSNCGVFGSNDAPYCPGAGKVSIKVKNASGSTTYCSRDDSLPANRLTMWQSIDVSACLDLGTGDSTARINDVSVEITPECVYCFSIKKKIATVELIPTIGAKTAAAKTVLPSGGCRTSPSGYSAGVGDAAVLTSIPDSGSWISLTTSDAHSRDCALISGGRVSINGTIYSPSDALEIADTDSRYPFASRGIVARHLRIRSYNTPLSPQEPAISNSIDSTPKPREATFVACVRADTTKTEACGTLSGDRVLTRARFGFGLDNSKASAVPGIVWWSTDR